jgi:hypothetical protein
MVHGHCLAAEVALRNLRTTVPVRHPLMNIDESTGTFTFAVRRALLSRPLN